MVFRVRGAKRSLGFRAGWGRHVLRVMAKRMVTGFAVFAGVAGLTASGIVGASGDARTISFFHIHTKETLTVLYKKDGKYIPDALKKINWVMRDWRLNQEIPIDPHTIDIAWEMHHELGSREPIHIICGYRSSGTNSMLRRTRGGQASNSQHMTGKAIDITFPDVPIRRLRYSAMIRERGGVGYYPTGALPFVHIDTARVRHWPRMPRDELALLFPSGRTRHNPASGGDLSPDDARRAKQKNPELAMQVAQFFDVRSNPNTSVLVAAVDSAPSTVSAPAPQQIATLVAPAPRPAVRPEPKLAEPKLLEPKLQSRLQFAAVEPARAPAKIAAAPKLVAEPKQVDRSSKFITGPSKADRSTLDKLVTLASLATGPEPVAKLTVEPQPLTRKPASLLKPVVASMSALGGPGVEPKAAAAPVTAAAAEPDRAAVPSASPASGQLAAAAYLQGRFDKGISWVAAPAYDEDHPEELSYQPFPTVAMLTQTASFDDPALATLVHPDAAQTLSLLDDNGGVLPMRFRPGIQTAQLMWSQQFTGKAVSLADFEALDRPAAPAPATAIAERSVKTSQR